MAVEAGAKTAIFEADEIAMEYLRERGREPKAVFHSDEDAVYVREYTFDLSQIEPVAARPDFVDDVVPAKEVCGIRIDEAFLGSCNNGRNSRSPGRRFSLKGKKSSGSCTFSGGSGQPGGISAGTGGRPDFCFHGKRSYCHESQLQCLLGQLSGCHWRK